MKGLTTRQEEILSFIQGHHRREAYWPSIREIQESFGFRSTNAVIGHLRALERKGFISRVPGQARAYRMSPAFEAPANSGDVIDVPIYGAIAAGYPDGVETAGEIGRLQLDISTSGLRSVGNAFALKVRGESMIDAGIFDGDLVIVEPGEPMNGDIVAALIDNETTLKRYIIRTGCDPYLKAENPDYPSLFPVSELFIQGIVRTVVRRL
ncbi:MAG: transcriptional repressor LexA [Opitutales bacterium]